MKQLCPMVERKQQRAEMKRKKKQKKRKLSEKNFPFCTPLGIRTLDPLIKSQLLYQLS